VFDAFYSGRRVLVTGHTGFKGSWLAEWLLQLGAEVTGFSLAPPTSPALFDQLGLADRLAHRLGDVRDPAAVAAVVADVQPDLVFHLAAQAIVRTSYEEPLTTLATNVMGTAHVLDAVFQAGRPCAVVVVTSDKVYENREWLHGYRESDHLGGADPYSASKACAELVTRSYRRSFGDAAAGRVAIASARAGNVVGGGDWAEHRILPDCVRALRRGESIAVRNPASRRPWQHVLEPLAGYLWLGRRIHPEAGADAARLCQAFNFGPSVTSNRTVAELVEAVLGHWEGAWDDVSGPTAPPEAGLLSLDCQQAWHELGWRPVWTFATTIEKAVTWYRRNDPEGPGPTAVADFTRGQIHEYCEDAHARGLIWARGTTSEDRS